MADQLLAAGEGLMFPAELDAGTLQRSVGTSAAARKAFRAQLGLTPSGYLTRCQMEAAKSLLRRHLWQLPASLRKRAALVVKGEAVCGWRSRPLTGAHVSA